MVPDSGRGELSSWKEIAAYLGVSVRTAQLWEGQRGLPVRRLPGPRGQVTALVADVDAWRDGPSAESIPATIPPSAPEASSAPEPSAWLVWRHRWPYLAGTFALLLVLVWMLAKPVSRAPVGYRLDQQDLVVVDDHGQDLWRQPIPGLYPLAYGGTPGLFWAGDLDGKGTKSVIFVARMAPDGPSDTLFCYSAKGKERWHFDPGKKVRRGTEEIVPPFRIMRFAVLPDHQVVVTSEHHIHDPAQVALLGPDGVPRRDYWHAGHLPYLLLRQRQGRTQIVLGGVNDPARTGTIIVLDPATMGGAASEAPADQFHDMPVAHEVSRILFPRSNLNVAREPFVVLAGLWEEPDEIVAVLAHRTSPLGAGVYYHFSRDLVLRNAIPSDSFEHELLAAQALHLLRIPIEAERELLQQVRYLARE